MIPSTVRFTGLDIDPMTIIEGRIKTGNIPTQWIRFSFETEYGCTIDKMNRWLFSNIDGKWAIYLIPIMSSKRVITIAFENDTDAVMFRLKGGETAWKIADQEFF